MTSDPRAAPRSMPDGAEPMPDPAVVARVLAGEPRLFELLMRRYNRRLFRVARGIVRSDGEAEDVVQQSWLRAYAGLAQFEGRSLVSTWLTRICVHEALARTRKSARLQPLDDEEDVIMPTGTPEQRASDAELRRALEEAIDELPEGLRVVFVMRSVEGLSVEETAEALGIEQATVKTRAFRARAQLQQRLAERFDAVATGAFDFQGARCDRIVAFVLERIGSGR